MFEATFKTEIIAIYAAHGRGVPSGPVLAAIWDRVDSLPDAFMRWAAGELREMETLPANLGLYLHKNLWPLWDEKNRPQQTDPEPSRCPDCTPPYALPGSGFWVWRHSGGSLYRYFAPCRCSGEKRFFTRPALDAQGWSIQPPETERGRFARTDTPENNTGEKS
ncbi:MAG: hypothetical protein LBD82_01485 [Deltaproteobacteria bacterium]|jgi:hypothetical protein|nr:hypothetical protein [Deltaproteobacteria bacterium]